MKTNFFIVRFGFFGLVRFVRFGSVRFLNVRFRFGSVKVRFGRPLVLNKICHLAYLIYLGVMYNLLSQLPPEK